MALERLQKIIASRGYCSRRKAEELITLGKVKVDGTVVMELGAKFDTNAKIIINNQPLEKEELVYFLFNKPKLVLTSMKDPQNRKTVADFFDHIPERVYPVGRLDYDVSGAIIMTNDGELANFIMHPKYGFLKTYQAVCKGRVEKSQLKSLLDGVIIDDDYKTKALVAELEKYNKSEDTSVINLVISEGRNHHVKKMLIAADIYLSKLMRTHIEFLNLDNIGVGQYRPLKPREVKKLYGLYNSKKLK